MFGRNGKRTRFVLALALLLMLLTAVGVFMIYLPSYGVPERTPIAAFPAVQTRNITLYVRDNWLKTPDGQRIYVIGYTNDARSGAQVPGPILAVNQGDIVNITVVNDKGLAKTQSERGVMKQFAGASNSDLEVAPVQAVDGLKFPASQNAAPAIIAMTGVVQQGQQITYRFTAQKPGTYWYHGAESALVQMGMYGALIIRPSENSNQAYAGTAIFDKEYAMVLSDMDSTGHEAAYRKGAAMNWADYHPDYYFFNGKTWPDTMMDSNDNINATIGQTVLVRMINAGSEIHMIHTHGFHFLVIGTNGHQLEHPYYKDTILMVPGECDDLILQLDQAGRYMMHDHIEQDGTNNGLYPGGMMTMINVNLPDGTNPVKMPSMSGNGELS